MSSTTTTAVASESERHFMRDLGPILAKAGYPLTPIMPPDAVLHTAERKRIDIARVKGNRGKAPGFWNPEEQWKPAGWWAAREWQTNGVPTSIALNAWSAWPAHGIGVLMGKPCSDGSHLIFVDADIYSEREAAELDALAVKMLGAGPKRIGRAPKWGRVYRTAEAMRWVATGEWTLPGDAQDAKKHRVEVLGAGLQFVAYGIHQSTGQPYAWPEGDLFDMAPADLPMVTPEQVQAYLAAAGEYLGAWGGDEIAPAPNRPAGNAQQHAPEEYRAADPDHLAGVFRKYIKNEDLARAEWVKTAYAVRAAFDTWEDNGRDLFVEFSASSSKCTSNGETASGLFDRLDPGNLHVGALWLYALAHKAGWEPDIDLPGLNLWAATNPADEFSSMFGDLDGDNDNEESPESPYVFPFADEFPWLYPLCQRATTLDAIRDRAADLSALRRHRPEVWQEIKMCWNGVDIVNGEDIVDAFDAAQPAEAFWTETMIAAAADWTREDLEHHLPQAAALRRDDLKTFDRLADIWSERLDAKDRFLDKLDRLVPPTFRQIGQEHHAPRPQEPHPELGEYLPPPRPWVLGRRFMAGTVTIGIGAPGAGKSSFALLSCLAVATGRNLTGEDVVKPGPAWYYDAEDDRDEVQRRLAATMIAYGIDRDEIGDRLVISGKDDRPMVLAKKKERFGDVAATPAVGEIIDRINAYGIVHLAIGPLVSLSRGIDGNDNSGMDEVAGIIKSIATQTGASVDVTHHSVKSHSGNSESRAGDLNAARGAGAVGAAARGAYTLSPMSEKTTKDLGLDRSLAGRLVRFDGAKANYAPGGGRESWFEFRSVVLDNGTPFSNVDADGLMSGQVVEGDSVGVLVPWNLDAKQAEAADRAAETSAERHQSTAATVIKAMTSDSMTVARVVPAVMRATEYKESKVRKLITEAVPEGEDGISVTVDGTTWTLRAHRDGDYTSAPVILTRRRAED